MNTRINDAQRRPGGRDPSGPGEPADARRRWRTRLAGLVVAAMALGGVSALAAAPASADELPPVAADQATPATDTATAPAEDPAPATEEPAPAPAEDPAPAPADDPAATPAEDPAAPTEETETPAEPADQAVAPEAAAADAPVTALLVPPGEEVVEKVTICHRTDSYKNPYVINEPNANGDVDGHATEHVGPVFSPEIPKHTEWGDIIPPFYYGDPENPSFFPGLNWDAEGQAIYENDCVVPTQAPVLEITPMSCVEGGPNGQLDFTLGPLLANLDYRVTIWDSEDNLVAQFGWSGISGNVQGSAGLAPGDYTITVEQSIIAGVWEVIDEQSFTIEECPVLAVTAAATACSLGDDGTALVSLSGLVVGDDYDWTLVGDGVDISDVLTAPSESLDVPFGDLPPGSYEFTITSSEDEEMTASAEFFVEPCQPEITVVVTECPAYGEDGSALLKLSNLVEGVEYDVWVTAKGDEHGTIYDGLKTVTGDATHVAEVDVSPLMAGKDYTAWVHGVWADSDDEFELHASADFTLKPCPPAKPVTPAGLAVTGTSDPAGPIAAALLLLGLGGAALVARRRREGRIHGSE